MSLSNDAVLNVLKNQFVCGFKNITGEPYAGKSGHHDTDAPAVVTTNGAYASYEEALKGSITAGKLADFVVLADDPHTVDQSKIKDITIVRTVVGGNTVYQS